MSKLYAIETFYNKCRFRSRLEARWAVFFDSLGIQWDYEKEGFELPTDRYLPDFFLPKQQCWIEIKGTEPNGIELALLRELVDATEFDAFLFSGKPNDAKCWAALWDGSESFFAEDRQWARCHHCKATRPVLHGATEKLYGQMASLSRMA